MVLQLSAALLGMFLVAAEPAPQQSRVISRSDDGKVTMSKPSGDTEIEIMDVDRGDYRLLYYLRPDWKAGSVEGENGRRVPVKLELLFVLRLDELTGTIDVLDEQLGTVTASGEVDCTINSCGGACCAIVLNNEVCVICTCCVSGRCGIVLDTCNTTSED